MPVPTYEQQPQQIPAPVPVPAQIPAPVPVPAYPESADNIPVPSPAVPIKKPEMGDVDTSGFSVTNPMKGSHTTYSVTGEDAEGQFEGSRRYNDFHAVRDHL